jgi:hypothetical protein
MTYSMFIIDLFHSYFSTESIPVLDPKGKTAVGIDMQEGVAFCSHNLLTAHLFLWATPWLGASPWAFSRSTLPRD